MQNFLKLVNFVVSFKNNTMNTKVNQKKEQVSKRIEKLDPNNNKNLPDKKMIKKRGRKEHDDNFEHRSSGEISPLLP